MNRFCFIAAGLAACFSVQHARSEDAPKKSDDGRPFFEKMLKEFDKDADGRLNEEELRTARQQTEMFFSRVNSRDGQNRPEFLKRFDKDGDGKLSDEEKAVAMKERDGGKKKGTFGGFDPNNIPEFVLKKFDKDGDGKLNDSEKAEARKGADMLAKGKGDPREMMKRFDKDGDGKLSDSERAEFRKSVDMMAKGNGDPREMMKRFDQDGDGKLSEEERAAAREAFAKMQGRPGGPGGFPSREEVIKRFDKDGDGQLNSEEQAAAKAEFERRGPRGGGGAGSGLLPGEGKSKEPTLKQEELLKKYDKDGDGKLNDEEKAAAREALQNREKDEKKE